MHVLNPKPGEALSTAITEALKVDQMHDDSIEGEVKRHFEESILALSKPMEHADLSTVVREGMVKDLRVVGVHSRISWVIHILPDDLDARGEDILALIEGLKHLQVETMVVNVEHIQLHLITHRDGLLGLELMVLELCDKFAKSLPITSGNELGVLRDGQVSHDRLGFVAGLNETLLSSHINFMARRVRHFVLL